MATIKQEAECRTEFERLGELLVYENAKQRTIYNDEAKRQAALRWLSEQSRLRNKREIQTLGMARWTLGVAIAGMVIGIISLLIMLRD